MKPKCLKMYISHILRIVNCLRPVREFFTDMATSPRTGEWIKNRGMLWVQLPYMQGCLSCYICCDCLRSQPKSPLNKIR